MVNYDRGAIIVGETYAAVVLTGCQRPLYPRLGSATLWQGHMPPLRDPVVRLYFDIDAGDLPVKCIERCLFWISGS